MSLRDFPRRLVSRPAKKRARRNSPWAKPYLEVLEDRLAPAVLTVNSTADDTTNTSYLTLRDAILLVDSGGDPFILRQTTMPAGWQSQMYGDFGINDTIDFNIGTGLQVISPTSPLPAIVKPVKVNGYSEFGASANTLATGDNAVLEIELNGSGAGVCDGLNVYAAGCVIQGVVIDYFAGNGIELGQVGQNGTGGSFIQGNFIGIDPTGEQPAGNGSGSVGDSLYAGIQIVDSPGNTIGGTTALSRNVISGNVGDGIEIDDQASSGNTVEGNYIGTDASGLKPVGNFNGIILTNANGGTGYASFNIIGAVGGGNVISGNRQDGVRIFEGSTNTVSANDIGVGADGQTVVANAAIGVDIVDASNNVIGGVTSPYGNVISGNKGTGITILSSPVAPVRQDAVGNMILNNHIGTDYLGTAGPNNNGLDANGNPLGNYGDGVQVNDLLTGDTTPSNTFITGNVVGDNGITGVKPNLLANGIELVDVSEVHILGNVIGANTVGTTVYAIPNAEDGISLNNAFNNFIGGAGPDQNDLQGPGGSGITIFGQNSQGNQIAGNIISGFYDGIDLGTGANNNTIGGGVGGPVNTICFNEYGIQISSTGTSNNTIDGNLIGIAPDPDASTNGNIAGVPEGNMEDGINVSGGASGNIIGRSVNTSTGFSNVISANPVGIQINGATNGGLYGGNTVLGNRIGTNLLGQVQSGFGNTTSGVTIDSSSGNTIGGPGSLTHTQNEIEDNQTGIIITGVVSVGNNVQGNTIAFNSADGVDFLNGAGVNTIGGAVNAYGNDISDNGGPGVNVALGCTHDAIRHNTIFGNGGPGIDLAGVNGNIPPNQVGSGANFSQNHPVLVVASSLGSSCPLGGYLYSIAGGQYTIEIFAGPENSLFGDAETFVTSFSVTADSSGIAIFPILLPAGLLQVGQYLTATATDGSGDTSDFSLSVEVTQTTPTNIAIYQPLPDSDPTLESPAGTTLALVAPMPNPSPDDAPPHVDFDFGFVSFVATGFTPGQAAAVDLFLPAGSDPTSYYRYGPTPDNPSPHWYDWLYNGTTGAQIDGNEIVLNFIVGGAGDDDRSADGMISQLGGPGFPDPFTVTNTSDSGAGSLRQAIVNANANPGSVITFDIPGSGPQLIQPLSPLPAITAYATIDGTTQPGYAGTPLIELNGSLAGPGANGLTLDVEGSTVQGLDINQFSADGILLNSDDNDQSYRIQGNYLGTDPSGKIAMGNGSYGLEIDDASYAEIGGFQATEGNVISGNAVGGIYILGGDGGNNQVYYDLIGTQADGVRPLGNGGPGVVLDGDADNNYIGSDYGGQGNTIAFNAGPAVEVLQSTGNAIEGNSIFSNGSPAIHLAGAAANNMQAAPVLTQATSYAGETYLTGTVTGTPDDYVTFDFYVSPTLDSAGLAEGQTFLGSTSVNTDDNGQANLAFSLTQSLAVGSYVTATATSYYNGTSAFSAAAQVQAGPLVLTVNTADDVDDPVPDPNHFSLREAILAANSHPGLDIIRFDLPDQDRVLTPLTPLPVITDPVIIDGTSQPGYQSLPLVVLDGSIAGEDGNGDGLQITGGGSVVRGLVINGFQTQIELDNVGGNLIEGNFLGTDVTGTSEPAGEVYGVYVNNSPSNIIGGTTPQERNLITGGGVDLEGAAASGNLVEGDYIGTDVTGTVLLNAVFGGITIAGATSNTIGGSQPGAGNLIAGGVHIFDASSNIVQGNLIGTDVTGTVYLGGGVEIRGASNSLSANNNVIGGTTPAARNIIPGGISISGYASYNLVQGNYIGTDITGTVPLHADATNQGDGIDISGAFNTIGGTQPGAGNLISGNPGAGISIGNTVLSHDNTIQGNRIGTDVTGTKPLGNYFGIISAGSNNTIGGSMPGAGNVISGNVGNGLNLGGNGSDVVQGNFIGTDYTGTRPLPNTENGVFVAESNVTIGGTQPGAGNVISGNPGNGIEISANGATIEGNDIGTDITGTLPLGNGVNGISIDAGQNVLIGGAAPGAANVISANGASGISISATGTVVQGNQIGTDVTGTRDLGNAGDGVYIMTSSYVASAEMIGGTDPRDGNVIAYNGADGVSALFGAGDSVEGNDIFANGGLGIVADINGVLSTYAESRSSGLLQNWPLLTSAVFNPQGDILEGTLTGLPASRYEIDFFANTAVDPSGYGPGQAYLQSIGVVTDPTGLAQFQVQLDAPVPVGEWITATATDPSGTTSQFSQEIPVVAAVVPDSVQFSEPAYLVTKNGGAAVVVVTRTGSIDASATVDYATANGSATAGVNYTSESGTLTFAAGRASQTLMIPIQDDGVAEGNENFTLTLSNPVGVSLGSVPEAVVTIADDDSAGQINFAASAVSLADYNLGQPKLVVTRSGGSHGRVTVDYRVTGGTAPVWTGIGSSTGTLYQDFYGTLTFEDGQTTATILITAFAGSSIIGNALIGAGVYLGPQTIQVTLGNPTGGATLGSVNTTVLTITDDDDLHGGFLVAGAGTVEGTGPAYITVTRTGATNTQESVSYTTVDGTARAGVNYIAESGTLTFQKGQVQQSFTIPVLDDGVVAGPYTFQVVFSNPTGGAIFDGQNVVNVPITEGDSPGTFSVGSPFVQENAGSVSVTIYRSGGVKGVVSVHYATSDGTAKAGTDYTATSGTLFFANGQSNLNGQGDYQTFSIPVFADDQVPGNKTFFVTLSDPTGGASITGATGMVTIYQDLGQFQFSASNYTVAEANAGFTVTIGVDNLVDPYGVIMSNGYSAPTTVHYSVGGGTAQAGVRYLPISGTLVFGDGSPYQQTITIPILNDSLVNGNQTVLLTLSDPTGGTTIGSGGTTTLTILDNDQASTPVTITGSPDRPANAAGWYNAPVTVTFTASGGDGSALSVTGPVALSSEGAGQSVTGTASDNAGDSASTTVSGINIDLTPPISTAAVATGTLGTNGWYTSGVTVSLTATDNLSGVADTYYEIDGGSQQAYTRTPFTVTGDLVHTIAFWSVDNAGNIESAKTLTVMIDKVPPIITGAPDRSANSAGWYNAPVTVTFTASDALSGLADVTGSVTLSSDGAGQSVAGTATDIAGNAASTTVSGINIDLTPPTTTAAVANGNPGASGWYTSDVTVSLSASDNLSGVAGTFYQIEGGSQQTYTGTPFAVTGDLVHTITFWSVDNAGNTEILQTFTVKIDTTAPTIAGTPDRPPNAAGWYNAPVTVTFTASDALSGLASVSGPVTLSAQGAGQSVTGTATDYAGNSANATVSAINIDLSAPTTTAAVASGTLGNNGWYTSYVTLSLSASDNLSGVAATLYAIDGSSQQIYTGTPFAVTGNLVHTITFLSVDKAGNSEHSETFVVKIDTTPPTVSIGPPSATTVSGGGSAYYTVTYSDANLLSSNLSTTNVHLVSTGSAAGTLSFDSSTGASRTVTISGISGNGTLAIRIDAGSASDQAGNQAAAAGPSAAVSVLGLGSSVLLLDPTSQGALTASGNGEMLVNGSSAFIVDSTNSAAAVVSGNASITAELFSFVGAEASTKGLIGQVKTKQAAEGDPLAGTTPPSPTTPAKAGLKISCGSVTIQPGTYQGGIQISGQAQVTMAPGVYYLQGGGLSVSGQARLLGTGVLIYNAPEQGCDGITFTGQAQVFLSAMTSGAYAGILLWQNAKATAPFTVSGSANVNLKGDLDLPMALASISGNAAVFEQAAAATACFVVKDLNLSGNGLLDLGNALGNSLSVPTGPVSPGQTKSLCFWQGQGQALIHSFAAAGAGTVTAGAWLAANFPNLFGSLATANNAALVAAVDTASGLYGQALALGLNIYATTFGLGGQTLVQDALAFQYCLQVTLAGAGAATEDVGCDAAAFGLPAGQNTTLTLLQILQTLDNDYNPTERLFFSGDATLIGEATNVLPYLAHPLVYKNCTRRRLSSVFGNLSSAVLTTKGGRD